MFIWLQQQYRINNMDTSEIIDLIKNAYHSTDDFNTFSNQINSYSPQLVIDAGCGNNLWKNKVNNLVGFDKQPHKNLDHNCTYEEFDNIAKPNSADFIFCLGSIHSKGEVDQSLAYVYKWLKPGGRIIMRVRADIQDTNIDAWDIEKISQVQEQYNYSLVKPIELKKIILNDLDNDTFKWLKSKATTRWEKTVIDNEQHRRDNSGNDINIFKSWYIWWWQKPIA